MKWQSGKGRSAGCGGVVIKHSPTLSHSRVFGKPLLDWRLSEFSATARWAVTWAFAQPRPASLIYLHNFLQLAKYSPTSPPTVMAQ